MNNGSQIEGPINTTDIATVIGASSNDVGTLCRHPNINKWAIYKPQNISSIGEITLDQRIADHMGLTPVECSTLKSRVRGNAAAGSYTMDVSELKEWTYTKPSLTDNHYCRMSDFLDITAPTGRWGYNHLALPCDAGWGEFSIDIKNLDNLLNASNGFSTSGSGISFTFSNTANSWKILTGVSFRFNTNTATNMGSADNRYMPLSYVVHDGFLTGEYWRMGMLVWIPYTITGAIGNFWVLFVGKDILRPVVEISKKGEMLIDLGTNQYGCECIKYCRMNKSIYEFSCVPVLVENVTTGTISENGNKQTLSLLDSFNAKIYSMPSGSGVFKMTVTNDSSHAIEKVDVDRFSNSISLRYKIGVKNGITWYVAIMYVGDTDSINSTKYPIYNLLIVTNSTSPVTATLNGEIKYTTRLSPSDPERTLTLSFSSKSQSVSTMMDIKNGGGNYATENLAGAINMGFLSSTLTIS